KEELERLLATGFIKPIDYSEWISNVVPVQKKPVGIIIFTDFRDINKACPKYDFPFPNIDMIVNSTVRYEIPSLMAEFLGYNQIKIEKEDQHKMTFTTPWGTFCYQVIPFGLKNSGVTYQREMTVIFHDMLHKIMKDYVDNILGNKRQEKTTLKCC
ncbi:hypothetical protein KI387_044472, partial [Taxus chinensis]